MWDVEELELTSLSCMEFPRRQDGPAEVFAGVPVVFQRHGGESRRASRDLLEMLQAVDVGEARCVATAMG